MGQAQHAAAPRVRCERPYKRTMGKKKRLVCNWRWTATRRSPPARETVAIQHRHSVRANTKHIDCTRRQSHNQQRPRLNTRRPLVDHTKIEVESTPLSQPPADRRPRPPAFSVQKKNTRMSPRRPRAADGAQPASALILDLLAHHCKRVPRGAVELVKAHTCEGSAQEDGCPEHRVAARHAERSPRGEMQTQIAGSA